MKNRCTSISRKKLLALLLSALLLLGMLPVIGIAAGQSETKGSLTVKLSAESQKRLSGGSSVPEVTLYQIGLADPLSKSGWTMHTEFARFGVIEAASPEDLAGVAKRIIAAIEGNSEIQDQGQTKPMTDGQVLFDNLDLGIYLGVVTGVPVYVEVTPFIVTVPARNPKEPYDLRFNYDVTVKDEWVTSLTVKKVWKDGDNRDKIRPDDIVVQVKNGSVDVGEPITLNEANKWQATVPNLAMYANDNLITYTVDELSVPDDYTKTVSKDLDDTPAFLYEIENAHTPEETAVKVTKKWTDADDQDGYRPESIEVQLKNGDKNVGDKVTLNADNDWTYTWTKLYRNEDGVRITYTLDEVSVPDDYAKTVTKTADGVDLVEYEIENKHTTEEISVKVTKTWTDGDDQDAIRPDSVVVQLKNGTENVGDSVTLNAGNNWSHTWTKLPKNAGGAAIDYTVDEVKVPTGYKKTVTKLEGSADLIEYAIDNAHTPTETEATIVKIWQDDDDKDGLRPKSISVSLLRGTAVVKTVELSDANGWKETVPNLPKYDKGKEIKYTWSEATVDGYTSTQVTNGTITELTNVHTTTTTTPTTTTTTPPDNPPTEPAPPEPTPTPTTTVSIRKVWDDGNNQHKKRPQSITIMLLADGTQVDQKTISGSATSTAWSFTFTNLPELNEDGSTINYTVDEVRVQGYEPPVVDGTTITNKLTEQPPREYRQLTGKKTWIEVSGTGETAPRRPNSIKVYLVRDGEVIDNRTVTAASDWTYDFGKYPVDDGYGHVYSYTVREDGVPGYFCKIDGMNLINTWLTNEKPPEDGDTPKGNPPTRKTTSDQPPVEDLTEEEFDELFDVLDYNTPLWGQLLGTGDETPIYPYIFGGVGVLAIIALLVFGRKRKKQVK